MELGIFPGWHMNKLHWLTVALDGYVEDEILVDMSYGLNERWGSKCFPIFRFSMNSFSCLNNVF